MAEPIVERIAQWLLAALQQVTTANGYHQTLRVSRPLEPDPPAGSFEDLSAVLEMGDRSAASPPTLTHRHWRQTFFVAVYLLGRDAGGVCVDQRINRVVADIEKRIGVEIAAQPGSDKMAGGLAFRLHAAEPEIWIDRARQATVVLVPIEADYKVKVTDPYSQS